MMVRAFTLIVAVVAVLACPVAPAVAKSGTPISHPDWLAVINDWLAHERFAARHDCASVVVARTHAPPHYTEGTPLVHALDVYESRHCGGWSGSAESIKLGMSNRDVVAIAGPPVPWRSGPRCWWYRTPGDGRSICFNEHGYVAEIRIAVSG